MDDPNELISVYEAENVTDAHFVRDLLADEGIQAVVTEEHDPIALPITPPHVLVRKADLERAQPLIDRFDEDQVRRAERPDWICPACGATVVGAFDECDVCGANRPGSEVE